MKWNAEAQRIDIFPGDSPEDIFRRIASAFHLSSSQIDDYIGDPVVIDLISFFSTKIKNESAALELLRNGNNNLELEIGKLNLKVKELQTERDSFQTRYIENLNSTQEMMNQHSKTVEENNALKAEKKILLDQNRILTERLNRMLEQNFGVKSEKTDQLKDEVLHGEEWKDPLSEDAAEEENKEQDSGKTGTLKYKLQKPRKPKRKGKRKEDLSKLPVQTVYEYDIDK